MMGLRTMSHVFWVACHSQLATVPRDALSAPRDKPGERTKLMHRRTTLSAAHVLLMALSVGCAHTAMPRNAAPLHTLVATSNFTRGEAAEAVVGEPLVRVKNYTVIATEAFESTGPFQISGGLSDASVSVVGSPGQSFGVVGDIEVSGEKMPTITIPGSSALIDTQY